MSNKVTPSLESITVKAKYSIPLTDFYEIKKRAEQYIGNQPITWKIFSQIGDSVVWIQIAESGKFSKQVANQRAGIPCYLSIVALEKSEKNTLVEVECRPVMWYKISKLKKVKFTENEVQESILENASFVKQVMSIFKAKEIEPVSVYPIIQRTEIKGRLLNLGLKETVDHLDKAERHIVQNNFEESLKSSRTAFEKMIDWEIKKRGLEETNNYKNNLERLKSKGFIDPLTTELIQAYYRCLSNIAVHAKGEVPPGFHEAQMGYGMTLIMLQYFADKLP